MSAFVSGVRSEKIRRAADDNPVCRKHLLHPVIHRVPGEDTSAILIFRTLHAGRYSHAHFPPPHLKQSLSQSPPLRGPRIPSAGDENVFPSLRGLPLNATTFITIAT